MSTKKPKRKEQSQPCSNHPSNADTEECERCHKFFCAECYIEDWHENFLYQFVGKKREFVKRVYCSPCQKRVQRMRLIAYLGLFILLVGPFILWFILNIFF